MLLSSRSLDRFIQETMKDEPPTPDEELALCKRIDAGDEKAKEELVLGNMRLVMHLAKLFRNHGVSMDDLVQEGAMASFEAARTYNHTKGFKFSSWAAWYIKNALKAAISTTGHAVSLPRVNCSHTKTRNNIDRMKARLGRLPTSAEFMDETGTPGHAALILDTLYTKPVALDRQVSNSDNKGCTEGERLICDKPTPDDISAITSDRRLIESLLGSLTARESDIIVRRYGLFEHEPEVLDTIGADHGITRERTRQIQVDALKKLKKQMRRRMFQCNKKQQEAVA